MALDPPQDDQKDEPTNPAKRAGEGEDLTNAELEEEWELEIRRDDSDLRREEIESAFRQLEAEGQIEDTPEAAQAWALRIQGFAAEPVVHNVVVYESRLAEVVKAADRIRKRLGRRLQEPEFTGTMETHIVADDILTAINQCRSFFGRGLDLHVDLPKKGAEQSNKRDRQDWQLSWLAAYGPDSPRMPADMIILDDQSTSAVSTWLAAQQAMVFSIDSRPLWEDFLTLSDGGVFDGWFDRLYAHQRFLYVTGEFLIHLNELGRSLLKNRKRIATSDWTFLLQQLREMHLCVRDARNLFFPFPRVSQDTRED
jgi:hypothetical protein